MVTHSSILALKIPWTEEPGELQSMESPRVRHDCATKHTTYWVSAEERFTKVLKSITSLNIEATTPTSEGLCGDCLQEAVVTGNASFSPRVTQSITNV